VVVVDETTVGCWNSVELVPNGFSGLYCPFDETIYLDLPWLAGEVEVHGRAVVAVVLAHEWAHHVQHLLGVNPWATLNGNLSARVEQQADCLAGAWTAEAEAEALFTVAEVDGLVVVMVTLADPHGTTVDEAGRHGSGAQRARAFLEGYAGGTDACTS
jgi:predicted metalloprotease